MKELRLLVLAIFASLFFIIIPVFGKQSAAEASPSSKDYYEKVKQSVLPYIKEIERKISEDRYIHPSSAECNYQIPDSIDCLSLPSPDRYLIGAIAEFAHLPLEVFYQYYSEDLTAFKKSDILKTIAWFYDNYNKFNPIKFASCIGDFSTGAMFPELFPEIFPKYRCDITNPSDEIEMPVQIDTLKIKIDSIIRELDYKIATDSDYYYSFWLNRYEIEIIYLLIMNSDLDVSGYGQRHYMHAPDPGTLSDYYALREWYETHKDSVNWLIEAEEWRNVCKENHSILYPDNSN